MNFSKVLKKVIGALLCVMGTISSLAIAAGAIYLAIDGPDSFWEGATIASALIFIEALFGGLPFHAGLLLSRSGMNKIQMNASAAQLHGNSRKLITDKSAQYGLTDQGNALIEIGDILSRGNAQINDAIIEMIGNPEAYFENNSEKFYSRLISVNEIQRAGKYEFCFKALSVVLDELGYIHIFKSDTDVNSFIFYVRQSALQRGYSLDLRPEYFGNAHTLHEMTAVAVKSLGPDSSYDIGEIILGDGMTAHFFATKSEIENLTDLAMMVGRNQFIDFAEY